MSVKDAARTLGVGRPALSNLLNGNAALSPEMALRLEKTFGADRQKLLDLQVRAGTVSETATDGKGSRVRNLRSRLPERSKPGKSSNWADTHIRRAAPPVGLLRRLIHSTGNQLRRVDFPGYDNAERHGWDGFVDAGAATAWIPEGLSGWEFGVDDDPRRRPRRIYAARLSPCRPTERANCTFVFVTPGTGKARTIGPPRRMRGGEWKAVRASRRERPRTMARGVRRRADLAGREAALPITGFETLGHCLDRWTREATRR